MHGPVPDIPIRKPTKHELNTYNQITLTSFERWDPDLFLTSESHKLNELRINHDGTQSDAETNHFTINVIAKCASLIRDHIFYVSSVRHYKKEEISFSYSSKLWDIPLKVAKRTLNATENFSYSSICGHYTRRRRASHGRREHIRLSGNISRFCTEIVTHNYTQIGATLHVFTI